MTALAQAVERFTGARVLASRPLHGGDLSEVWHAELSDGRSAVAKAGALAGREARMLHAIRAAGAAAPEVLGCEGNVLVMQALEETASSPAGWAALGETLSCLHRSTAPRYGWEEDYAFGPVAIPNAQLDDWPEFWAARRLLASPAALPHDLRRRVEALCQRLPGLLPRRPAPALLHGDLWTGNVLFSGTRAYLIDPACYYGDREVDLAMLQLFGSPPPAFFEAYGPLDPESEERRAIYQLWPALVHLRLFGMSYRSVVESRLSALGF
ncbi:fructosamine kinase family protein [Roseobacteraceae bacterium NS-SX3]